MQTDESRKLNKNADRGLVTDAPNPFLVMHRLIVQSIGNLPAPLVIIIVLAMAVASLSAIYQVYYMPQKTHREFMPLRLEPMQGATNVDGKLLEGIWSYEAQDFAMTITLVGGKFEWIMKMREDGNARHYVRGNYAIHGDVIVLGSRNDMGAPVDPTPGRDPFIPLDIIDINFRASVDKDQMIWHVPVSEQNCYTDHAVHIFDRKNQADFAWKRVE